MVVGVARGNIGAGLVLDECEPQMLSRQSTDHGLERSGEFHRIEGIARSVLGHKWRDFEIDDPPMLLGARFGNCA